MAKEIYTGEIKRIREGKILTLVNTWHFNKQIREIICKRNKSDNQWQYIRLPELNSLIKRFGSDSYLSFETWESLIKSHLKAYIEFGYLDKETPSSTIKKRLEEFFKYMPYIRPERFNISDWSITNGYCCEDCDGDYGNFINYRFDYEFQSSVITPLLKLDILNSEQYSF